jgi:hypothetical protein
MNVSLLPILPSPEPNRPGLPGLAVIPAPVRAGAISSPRVMDLTVLIVDDDERLFELLAQYLAENGVIAKRAATGPAGLKAIESGESFDAGQLPCPL